MRRRGIKATSASTDTSMFTAITMWSLFECVLGREDGAQQKKAGPRLKMEWDLIFWLFASFAMLYFTNFASHILFDTIVKR